MALIETGIKEVTKAKALDILEAATQAAFFGAAAAISEKYAEKIMQEWNSHESYQNSYSAFKSQLRDAKFGAEHYQLIPLAIRSALIFTEDIINLVAQCNNLDAAQKAAIIVEILFHARHNSIELDITNYLQQLTQTPEKNSLMLNILQYYPSGERKFFISWVYE